MRDYKDMAEAVFRRRDEYVADVRRKKRIALNVSLSLCAVMLATVGAIGLWKTGVVEPDPNVIGTKPPVITETQTISQVTEEILNSEHYTEKATQNSESVSGTHEPENNNETDPVENIIIPEENVTKPQNGGQTNKPVGPIVRPDLPVVLPTLPSINPGRPVVKPTAPSINPERPVVKPTAPSINPERPVVKPTAPSINPERPVVKPTVPSVKPTNPPKEPGADSVVTEPTVSPTIPVPEKPVVKPTLPTDPVESLPVMEDPVLPTEPKEPEHVVTEPCETKIPCGPETENTQAPTIAGNDEQPHPDTTCSPVETTVPCWTGDIETPETEPPFVSPYVKVTITGKVTDQFGNPVKGAVVKLQPKRNINNEFTAVTDENGKFRIDRKLEVGLSCVVAVKTVPEGYLRVIGNSEIIVNRADTQLYFELTCKKK